MIIYLFRHGERTSRLSGSEPDLSTVGRIQADHLRSWVQSQTLPQPDQLWASPRIRTQNTLQPLSDVLQVPIQNIVALDERSGAESNLRFRERVERLLEQARQQSGVLFLCSHFDWLEEAITLIPADQDLVADPGPLWAPGAFVGFNVTDDIWKVRQKGQLQTW